LALIIIQRDTKICIQRERTLSPFFNTWILWF